VGEQEKACRERNTAVRICGKQSFFVEHVHPFASLSDFVNRYLVYSFREFCQINTLNNPGVGWQRVAWLEGAVLFDTLHRKVAIIDSHRKDTGNFPKQAREMFLGDEAGTIRVEVSPGVFEASNFVSADNGHPTALLVYVGKALEYEGHK